MPADKTPVQVAQSDGSVLTLRLVGDEFFHFNTTDDGYTVLRNQRGDYEYALKHDGQMVTSGVLAHDMTQRTAAERSLLATVDKFAASARQVDRGRQSRARINGPAQHEPVIDYSKFRGLIVLINYTDRKFMMDDPHDFYDKMVNERNFSYFMHNGRRQNCTGSVRDYFYDQSDGQFEPEFDVVGPIDIDFASTDHGGSNNSWRIFWAALDAIDDQVDFSAYDNDGDGEVDMVYFLVAGYSANYSGNNGNYLWPHKSFLYDYEGQDWITYDHVHIGTYASSCEIYGWESQGNPMPLGIGTMCHEFSHVLGLPDLYDTDYAEQGQSHDPGNWDVMASGGSYNYGRTPCAYSIWERYALGWNRPQEVTQPGTHTLRYVGNTGDGLIIRTPVRNEFFMLDNRQKTKWDAYLPGHGMLIARVDSTNGRAWDWNRVNANPTHNYYELLRAGNSKSGDVPTDPFPGTSSVTAVTNFTEPSLRTWAQVNCEYEIHNIRESGGVITFDVTAAEQPDMLTEDFEQMAASTNKNLKQVQGNFAKWNFTSANVAAPGNALCEGVHAVQMVKPSIIALDEPLNVRVFRIEFKAFNTSTTDAKFTIYSSVDGKNWSKMNNDYLTAPASSNTTLFYTFDMVRPLYFRITMAGGSDKQPCYVDDVKFYYTGELIPGDVTGDNEVDVTDINAIINVMLGQTTNDAADVNGDGVVDVTDINAVINNMLSK